MNVSHRSLWLGLAACLASAAIGESASAGSLQDRGPFAGDRHGLQVAQRAVLQLERERSLLEGWPATDETRRAAVLRLLGEGRDGRRSSLRPLGLAAVSRALRAPGAAGGGAELAPWRELVDGLGLRVTPGVFAARTEGRGEATTVHFEPLWRSRFEGNPRELLYGTLSWISSSGEITVARREPLTPRDLASGFEMYIRPPLSGAQTWELVLEVLTPAGKVRGFPVRVECVEDLEGWRSRLARAATGTEESLPSWNEPLRLAVQNRLRLLTDHGIRVANGLPLSHWLAAWGASAEPGSARPGPGGAFPSPLDGAELGVGGETFWEFRPEGAPARVLLLLTDEREWGADLLSGAPGEAWRRLARGTGTRVIAGHLPLGPADLSPLKSLARALGERSPAPRLFVVARGDSGRMLPRPLAGGPAVGLDGLILSETIAARVPIPPEVHLPVLRVRFEAPPEERGSREEGTEAGRRTVVGLAEPAPLALLQAIEAIGDWITSL